MPNWPPGYVTENAANKGVANGYAGLDSGGKVPTSQLPVVTGAMVLKGVIDCSGNPNYPAAVVGDVYVVSVAGKIGGVSGVAVELWDSLLCKTAAAADNQAAVGSSWVIVQGNINGADYQPPPGFTYVLDADMTPVIPAGGADCRWYLGVDTNGTTYTGITAARAINAPITGTPVDGQKFDIFIYDNGTVHNITFNAAFTPVGVSMPSNIIISNGTVNKAVWVSGRYNKAAGKWQIAGISYE